MVCGVMTSTVISLKNIPVDQNITMCLKDREYIENDIEERCFKILDKAEIETLVKESVFNVILREKDRLRLLGELVSMGLDQDLYNALVEVITA
ncbi:MAG: hypothetical protein HDR23_08330 [Lachnospiraceae bacterium]|nr:hypothetical protein [Lachnospiraceae bacterium]